MARTSDIIFEEHRLSAFFLVPKDFIDSVCIVIVLLICQCSNIFHPLPLQTLLQPQLEHHRGELDEFSGVERAFLTFEAIEPSPASINSPN